MLSLTLRAVVAADLVAVRTWLAAAYRRPAGRGGRLDGTCAARLGPFAVRVFVVVKPEQGALDQLSASDNSPARVLVAPLKRSEARTEVGQERIQVVRWSSRARRISTRL